MSEEPEKMDPETLVRYGCIETFNQGNVELARQFYADDAVYYRSDDEKRDLQALIEDAERFRAAFENLEADVRETVVEDDQIAFRYTVRGTHTGPFEGVPATGEQFDTQGIGFATLEDGVITEYSLVFDTLGMFQQLGVV